jgi:benzil reductase ((S)-benzoin forming)
MTSLLIITGPTAGLGKALATIAIRDNQRVLLVGRNLKDKLDDLILPEREHYIEVDFAFPTDCASIFDSFDFSSFSEINLVLNAATILPLEQIAKLDFTDFELGFNVNFLSQVALVKSLLSNLDLAMTKLGIINVTTGATTRVIDGWSCYSSSKAALEIFLGHLAVELPALIIQSFEPGVFESKIQVQIRSSLGHHQSDATLPNPMDVAQILYDRI